jgi:small-conductance mechanosensitive channel
MGLIANFTGHLRLAEIAIDLSITNTLVGLLLIISTVVLIGLFQLAIDGKYLRKFHFIKNRAQFLKSKVVVIMMLALALLWINYILQILRISEIFYQFLDSILNTKISLGTATFSMGSVLLFFFIIWLSVIVSDMIKAILEDDILRRISLKKGVPRMISVIIRFSLISIGIFLAVSAIGMPLNQLTIIISAFSVGIGFGLQNIVNNFVSGVVLLFERPVQIGDTVEVSNLIGNVKSMGIRSSNIRTFDGAEVIVPNANLISNEVINWTLSDKKRRIEIFSGVAYGSDVYLVEKILLDILNQHPDILKEPEPLVLFNDLGESSLDFRLLFWTENYERWIIIKSEVIFKIHDALNEAKIKIPFPQRDLHIKTKDND